MPVWQWGRTASPVIVDMCPWFMFTLSTRLIWGPSLVWDLNHVQSHFADSFRHFRWLTFHWIDDSNNMFDASITPLSLSTSHPQTTHFMASAVTSSRSRYASDLVGAPGEISDIHVCPRLATSGRLAMPWQLRFPASTAHPGAMPLGAAETRSYGKSLGKPEAAIQYGTRSQIYHCYIYIYMIIYIYIYIYMYVCIVM